MKRIVTLLSWAPLALAAEEEVMWSKDQVSTVVGNRYLSDESNHQLSIIDGERISKLQPFSYQDLLRFEPGVNVTGGPRLLGEQIEIRGEGGTAVNIRVDGVQQNFASGHSGQRLFVDPEFIRKTEILRGAGSYLYGSGSAGVVDIETWKASDFLGSERYAGFTKLGYSSVNDEFTATFLGAVGDENLNFLFGYSNRQSDDIRLSSGVDSAGSAVDRESLLLKGEFIPNDEHGFEFSFHHYTSEDTAGANPQVDTGTSNGLVNRDIEFSQLSLVHQYRSLTNPWIHLKTNIYYNATEQYRDYLAASGSNLDRENTQVFKSYGVEVTNHSEYQAFGQDHDLVLGMAYRRDEQEGVESRADFFAPGSNGTSSGRPNAEADSYSFFAKNDLRINDRLTLTAGVRFDEFDTSSDTGADQKDSEISPHIGVRYKASDGLSFFGTYSSAFNAPTLSSLYQSGSHFGVVPAAFFPAVSYYEEVFIPNESLIPETSQTFELGVDFNKQTRYGGFTGKFSYYQKDGKDTFDSEIVGAPTVTAGYNGFAGPGTLTQLTRQTVNRDSTRIEGFEASVTYEHGSWYARSGFSSITGEDDRTGAKLNTIPGDKFTLDVGYNVNERLTVGGYGLIEGSREDKVEDTSLQTGGYDIYGLFVDWKLRDDLTINAGVSNLFDQEYEVSSVSNSGTGRNFYINASFKF